MRQIATYKIYPNIINELEIRNLMKNISKINTYGYLLSKYFTEEPIEVVITNEDSIYIEDSNIINLTTRRGFAEDNKIVIHGTRYETIESIKWILLHELGHRIIKKYSSVLSLMYFVREKFYKEIGLFKGEQEYYSLAPNWREEYHKDEVHEKDPEEILVSSFATNIIGFDYSRHWWRENIRKIDEKLL